MLIVGFLIYFLPTIIALARGHLSALAIFLLNLLLGWTLIGWFIAVIWSCTGNTAANFHRLRAGPVDLWPPPRRSGGSLWLVLLIILAAIVLLDKRRDFRDVRSFDFSFPSKGSINL